MAAKTGQQVEDDIYRMVGESELPSLVSGGLYKFGTRPRDSKLEDIEVKFVTGYDDDIQTGRVVVNIYYPDFDPYDNGVKVRDITRGTELELAASEWFNSLTADKSDYSFRKADTIHSEQEEKLEQHFVTIRLKFKLPTF
jgi:hypothetical protein